MTFDWGEAFAALNLGAKPVLDRFFLGDVAEKARVRGDYLLGEIFFLARRGWGVAPGVGAGARAGSPNRRTPATATGWRAGRGRGARPRPTPCGPLAHELGVAR